MRLIQNVSNPTQPDRIRKKLSYFYQHQMCICPILFEWLDSLSLSLPCYVCTWTKLFDRVIVDEKGKLPPPLIWISSILAPSFTLQPDIKYNLKLPTISPHILKRIFQNKKFKINNGFFKKNIVLFVSQVGKLWGYF